MNIQLSSVKTFFAHFFERFHIIIFVLAITGGLGAITLLLNDVIVTSTDDTGYKSTSNSAAFDQSTINRIKQLKTRDETSGQLDLSRGRINPFVE